MTPPALRSALRALGMTQRELAAMLSRHGGDPFTAGAQVFYYPASRGCYSGDCGQTAARDFAAAAFDDAMMGG